jgi:hypothetical protein
MAEVGGRLTASKIESYNDIISDPNNAKEFIKCASDMNYFLTHYYNIVTIDEGLMVLPIRKWQSEAVSKISENKNNLFVTGRQQGKTSLMAGVLLWYGLFNNNTKIAIIANKFNRAKEVISMLDTAYTYLPDFLKMPLVTRNKSEVEFLNESRVKAYATSADSLRGETINCLYKETTVKIRNKKTGEIRTVELQELYGEEYK